jgi:oligopeptide/dipeptide ABC transporter ATP-binding protein
MPKPVKIKLRRPQLILRRLFTISTALLEVRNLKKYYTVPAGLLHAVDDISFTIDAGKTLGIVGESGCGKTTAGRAILRLIEPTGGNIIFDGADIMKLGKKEMRNMRRNMQLIFQDPFSSLNPRLTISETIEEPIKLANLIPDRNKRFMRVLELMDTVGLAERLINTYPHELDGGRRQRMGIARALAMSPKFIVCDEPVSALDVSIQAQILNLMKQIQRDNGITYIFITHSLSVVNHISDDIMVMYLGRIVEKAPSAELFANPLHPYTKALLSAIPLPRIHNRPERILLRGELTSPINPEPVCRFANRCDYATEACGKTEPALCEVTPGHFVSCHLVSGA